MDNLVDKLYFQLSMFEPQHTRINKNYTTSSVYVINLKSGIYIDVLKLKTRKEFTVP